MYKARDGNVGNFSEDLLHPVLFVFAVCPLFFVMHERGNIKDHRGIQDTIHSGLQSYPSSLLTSGFLVSFLF